MIRAPNCRWPNCVCQTEAGQPCRVEDPSFYIKLALAQEAARATEARKQEAAALAALQQIQIPTTADIAAAVTAFSDAAQEHGWASDQGSGQRPAKAKQEFEERLDNLLTVVSTLVVAARHRAPAAVALLRRSQQSVSLELQREIEAYLTGVQI